MSLINLNLDNHNRNSFQFCQLHTRGLSGAIAGCLSGLWILALPTHSTALVPPTSAIPPIATAQSLNPGDRRTVILTLADVIQVVVQSNRDLKNAQLDRIVQRQELKQAESRFNPRFTPSASIGINHSEPGTTSTAIVTPLIPTSSPTNARVSTISLNDGHGSVVLNNQTSFTSTAQVQAQLTTRIGTRLALIGDPLSTLPINLTATQPLLRGFGKTVNEAPIKVARLTYTKGALTLQQTLIDKITETITAYRTLYQSQERVRIQEASLSILRNQLRITTALVNAGRKARADLIDIEQRLADGERQLLEARNQLVLANSALVRLMDTGEDIQVEIPADSIEPLIQAAIARAQSFQTSALLTTAYEHRPDYLQAALEIDADRLNLVVAQDNKRWSLDLQNTISVGSPSQTTASLVLSREFGNPQLETDVQRYQVGIQKNTNRFNQLTTTIKREIDDQLQQIRSIQQQVIAAQKATQLAQQQFAIAQERFKRNRTSTIFELNQKEETLTSARNTELIARLDFWIAVAQLDKILGTTLSTWNIDNYDPVAK